MVSDEPAPPRLLIVDPRAILHLEYAACTVAVGFDVEQADNTEQGMAKATLLAPDIVLTDCSADTGGAGVEFCRRLKARVATSRIPVLGLIGAGDPLHATAAAVAGCTVLAKPCSPERLLVEIVRVLGVWPPGPAAAGSTTVDQLKSDKRTATIPVIVLAEFPGPPGRTGFSPGARMGTDGPSTLPQ